MEIFDVNKQYGLPIEEIWKKGEEYLNEYLDTREADFDRTFTLEEIHTYFPNQVVIARVLREPDRPGYSLYDQHKILYYRCNSTPAVRELYTSLHKVDSKVTYVQSWHWTLTE